jgi:hypothetical protein
VNPRHLVILAGLAALVWAFRRWRTAVQVAMVVVVFEGAVRKWLLPGAQDLIYFAKDVVLLGVYLGFLRDAPSLRHRVAPLPFLSFGLALAATFGLLQMFNPNLPNLLVGLLGFKAYFFYVPLLFVLPAAFPSDAAAFRFLRRYALLAIPVGALAVAQFLSPPSSVLNAYARTSAEEGSYATTFGSSTHVRVTATFPYITGYASYLLATSVLLMTLLAARRWEFRGSWLVYGGLGMTFLGMLMTGSRGPVLVFAVILPLYWWLVVLRERQKAAVLGRMLAGAALLAVFLSYAGGDAIAAFRGRASGSGTEIYDRMLSPAVAPFKVLPQVGVLGYGIGSTHQTAAALAGSPVPFSWLKGLLIEVESGRVMVELGPVGFFLIYLIRFYLAGLALHKALTLRTRFHRTLAAASFVFFLASIPGGVVFDVTAGVYYWFFAGLLVLALVLDRQTVRTELAAPARERPAPVPGGPLVPAAERR